MRCLHAERGDHLQFHRDHPVDGQRYFAFFGGGGETDLEMTALLAQAHDRVAAGGCDSKCIDGYVRAALGDIHNGLYRIGLLCIDHVRRPDALGQFELCGVQIDADYVSPAAGCQVDRGQTDAAASEYCNPFTGFDLRAVDDAMERGHEATAHRGGLDELDTVGEVHQVEVRKRHTHQTAEAARIGKA